MKKGFSLIELMVVIAIIAILAAIALPLYAEFTCKAQAQEAYNAVKDTKSAWAAARTTDEFDQVLVTPGEAGLVNDLAIELPTRNWDYTHAAGANTVTLNVTTGAGNDLKACVVGLTYDIQIDYVNNSVEFYTLNSTNPKYIKNSN